MLIILTHCSTGVEVGLAWLQQLCNTKATLQTSTNGKQQYVSGAGVSAISKCQTSIVKKPSPLMLLFSA